LIRVRGARPQRKQQEPKEFARRRIGRNHPCTPGNDDLRELFVPRGRRNIGTAIEYLIARFEVYELFVRCFEQASNFLCQLAIDGTAVSEQNQAWGVRE